MLVEEKRRGLMLKHIVQVKGRKEREIGKEIVPPIWKSNFVAE
jgi:hypothetical protein